MSSPGINTAPSLQTGGTWGTCATADYTVIATNKGSARNKSISIVDNHGTIGSKSKSNGSYDSHTSDNSTVLKAQMKRATSQTTEVKKTDKDHNLASLFNSMFCRGNESNGILEEREYAYNSKRVSTSCPNGIPTRESSVRKARKNAIGSDALILEQALKTSQKDLSPRRKAKHNRLVSPSDKLESLDIVMELQQQERTAPTKPRSPKKIRSPANGDESVMTDVFDFVDGPSTGDRCIQGLELGTFQNISSQDSALHPEVVNTYMAYRCDQKSIAMILSRLKCSIPLYHHGSNVLGRTTSEISATSGHSADTETVKISSKIKHVW